MKFSVKFEKHSKGVNFSVEAEGECSADQTLEEATKLFDKAKETATQFESQMNQ